MNLYKNIGPEKCAEMCDKEDICKGGWINMERKECWNAFEYIKDHKNKF